MIWLRFSRINQYFPSTLFPKRNATLISRFFMVTPDQGQWPWVMCTKENAPQMSSDCARSVRNFRIGFLTNCYQEQCTNEIWPKVHWPTLLPKRMATSEKLRFFWGRVYDDTKNATALGKGSFLHVICLTSIVHDNHILSKYCDLNPWPLSPSHDLFTGSGIPSLQLSYNRQSFMLKCFWYITCFWTFKGATK